MKVAGSSPAVWLGAGLMAVATCACASDAASVTTPDTDCFLAFNSAFSDFRSWPSYTYEASADVGGALHVAGPRTEYINQLPPPGGSTFPRGTILAKEVGQSDAADHHLFAMVKRGCGFNARGAVDWEWLEITEKDSVAAVIWRGVGPPAGEQYGGDPSGCNSCHVACSDNDAVCSSHFVLSNL